MGRDDSVDWLLLDIGGVLEIVDDETWPEEWASRWVARLGIPVETFAAAADDPDLPDLSRETGVEREYWQAFGEAVGASPEETAAMRSDFWDAYCGVANVQLLELLRTLRGRVGLAILSNSADGAREEEERRYGFASTFDPICYSHEIGVSKPEPAAFAVVLGEMGTEPGRVLFIDNWPANIDAARALGFRAHLHVDNTTTITAIRSAGS